MVNLVNKALVNDKRNRIAVALVVLAIVVAVTCLAVINWQLAQLADFSQQLTHHVLFPTSK